MKNFDDTELMFILFYDPSDGFIASPIDPRMYFFHPIIKQISTKISENELIDFGVTDEELDKIKNGVTWNCISKSREKYLSIFGSIIDSYNKIIDSIKNNQKQ